MFKLGEQQSLVILYHGQSYRNGNLISQDEQQVLVKDNFLDLNFAGVKFYSKHNLTFHYQATSSVVSPTPVNSVVLLQDNKCPCQSCGVSNLWYSGPLHLRMVMPHKWMPPQRKDNTVFMYLHANGQRYRRAQVLHIINPDSVNARSAFTLNRTEAATALTIRKVNLWLFDPWMQSCATGHDKARFMEQEPDTRVHDAGDAGNTNTTDASVLLRSPDATIKGPQTRWIQKQAASSVEHAIDNFVVAVFGRNVQYHVHRSNLTFQTATAVLSYSIRQQCRRFRCDLTIQWTLAMQKQGGIDPKQMVVLVKVMLPLMQTTM